MTIELLPTVEDSSEISATMKAEPTTTEQKLTVTDERSKSPFNDSKTSLNISTSSASEKNLSVNVASQGTSPNQSPVLQENAKRAALKRSRESSPDNKNTEKGAEPLNKTSRISSYSIMNILSKDNDEDRKQPAADAEQHQNPGMNQFLMNPFLAAAAAAAFSQQNNAGAQQQGHNPWFNMATMSALYGLESKHYILFYDSSQ